ncbi:linear gramicidin synthetase subunit C [Mycobacteroides abscessus subsp. abscessus]|nr:linear gramicidin synthetase subunit C [Mycobacteroides abscessus subsp. abscessus]
MVLDPATAAVTLYTATVTEAEVAATVRGFAAGGFDLAAAPPLRAALITVADPDELGTATPATADENVLVLVVHHIAIDGWSPNRSCSTPITRCGSARRSAPRTIPARC